ncbi:hypothetical protein AQUCO_05500006v1 [Aquilegia coerulea]|uniref:PHD-type domain-containing protein n=1 Tax=Aquilegia coerulea TaxID=218851 RepID=A0A2G5CGL6_AQUCA|nr:hypothetical protein AQUCO_05500006v1 [Aquilegia coerulea]
MRRVILAAKNSKFRKRHKRKWGSDSLFEIRKPSYGIGTRSQGTRSTAKSIITAGDSDHHVCTDPCTSINLPNLDEKRHDEVVKSLEGEAVCLREDQSLFVDAEIMDGTSDQYVQIFKNQEEGSNQDSLHPCQSSISCLEENSCLHNVHVAYGCTDTAEEFDSPDREITPETLQHSGHLEDNGGLDTTVLKLEMQQAIASGKNSKAKKTPKCKKISEIKLTELYDEPDDTPDNSLSLSSLRQIVKRSKSKKFQHQSNNSEELAAITSKGKNPKESSFRNDSAEVCLHTNNGSPDPPTCRKITKSKKSAVHNKRGRKRKPECQIDDDDFLIAALILNKNSNSASKKSTPSNTCKKKSVKRKLKSRKGSCKLLPRSTIAIGNHYTDGKWSSSGERTVLSWLIDVGVVSVNDVLQYRNPKDNAVVKDGWVTKDGILCKCCDTLLSVSAFKVHAGFKLYRPCSYLFMESGKPFTLCQLQAWSAEYKARKSGIKEAEVSEADQNDDTCGICADGGELLCCDNCPSTFHQSCLSTKELPEGNWYCPSCTCQICGNVVRKKEDSCSSILLKCSQCDHKYHSTCIAEGGISKVVSDTWFCGESCQAVYSDLHSRVGVSNFTSKELSWVLLKCNHGDTKVHSAQRFALTAECNSKLAVALTIMEECFLPMIDPRTKVNMIPQVIYSWGSEFARMNFEGFYTAVLEKGDELISVATFRIHGVIVAEMPLVATRTENRRQGMCRRLITAIEELLKSYKVERLVVSAIPSLVDTWTAGFGFKPMQDEEKKSLRGINFMTFPGTIMLGKILYEKEAKNEEAGTIGESAQQSDNNCNFVEAGLERAHVMKVKELQVNGEQKSHPKKDLSDPSLDVPDSIGDREQKITPKSECCSPKPEAMDICDGSQLLSTEP